MSGGKPVSEMTDEDWKRMDDGYKTAIENLFNGCHPTTGRPHFHHVPPRHGTLYDGLPVGPAIRAFLRQGTWPYAETCQTITLKRMSNGVYKTNGGTVVPPKRVDGLIAACMKDSGEPLQ